MRRLDTFFIIILICSFISCDEDNNPFEQPLPNDLAPQYAIENDSIIEFMKTHYYNYSDFENMGPYDEVELIIDSIDEENSDKISIFNLVNSFDIELKDSNDESVMHKIYYKILREGTGDNPTVADSVFISYKGMLLDNRLFDQRKYPIWLDGIGLVRGFQETLPKINKGDVLVNSDGTYDFHNYGIAMTIFPSGLGYYDNASVSIPAYSPLVFQINLMTINSTDHDNDGVPSIDEDLNGDHNFNNDDTDGDGSPNYFDSDDDNDGIPTKEEYDTNNDGIPDDSDGDGIPDYLDSE